MFQPKNWLFGFGIAFALTLMAGSIYGAATNNDDADYKIVIVTPTPNQVVDVIVTATPTITPTITPLPTSTPVVFLPAPAPAEPQVEAANSPQDLPEPAASVHPYAWGNDEICLLDPDRFNWPDYARAAGFPESAMEELSYIISKESGGDLCAVNKSSGATCWIQQLPGGFDYLDPATCMSIGYAKWVDGGNDFWRHWYQWWQ